MAFCMFLLDVALDANSQSRLFVCTIMKMLVLSGVCFTGAPGNIRMVVFALILLHFSFKKKNPHIELLIFGRTVCR